MAEEQGLTTRILSAAQRLEGGTASKLPYSPVLSDPARPAVQPDAGVMREMTPRMKAEQYGSRSLSGIGYAFNQYSNALPAGLEVLANLTNVERARSEGMAANVAAAREVGERFYEDPGSVGMKSYASEVNAPFPEIVGTLADFVVPGPGELVAGAKAVGAGVGAALAAGSDAVIDAARGLDDFARRGIEFVADQTAGLRGMPGMRQVDEIIARAIEGADVTEEMAALPWLRLTDRYLPGTADVIRQGVADAGSLDPFENVRNMFKKLDRNPDVDRVDYEVEDDYTSLFIVDDETGATLQADLMRAPDGQPEIHIGTMHNPLSDQRAASGQSSDYARGASTAAPSLNVILEIADAAGIRITTKPSPYASQAMPVGELRTMYNKLGFEWNPNETSLDRMQYMVRNPMPIDDAARAAERRARITPTAAKGPPTNSTTVVDYQMLINNSSLEELRNLGIGEHVRDEFFEQFSYDFIDILNDFSVAMDRSGRREELFYQSDLEAVAERLSDILQYDPIGDAYAVTGDSSEIVARLLAMMPRTE